MDNDINFIRKELDKLQIKVKNFDVTTQYTVSDSDTVLPSSAVWLTDKPSPTENKFIWVRNILNIGYGDIITEPYCIGDGLEHILSIDVEYIAWSDAFNPPAQNNQYWQSIAPSITTGQYIWTRTKIITTEETKYTDPVRVTGEIGATGATGQGIDGRNGKDGKGFEMIFCHTATVNGYPNNPSTVMTDNSEFQTDDYVPNGWSDDIMGTSEDYPYEYACVRTKDSDGVWSSFCSPKLWATFSEQLYCHVIYSDVNNPTNWNQVYDIPSTHKYEGYLWNSDETLQDNDKDPSKFTWRIFQPTIGINGANGSFLHIKYADDDKGTNMNDLSGAYMGTCVNYTPTDPNDPTVYSWVQLLGEDGVSITSITEQYGESNNSSTQPSSWSNNAPTTFVKGKWYWTRSKIIYSDNTASNPHIDYVGTRIINMVDSESEQYIFYRTKSSDVPTTPTGSTNVINFTKGNSGASYTGSEWTDDPQGATHDYPYEWCSMRTYNGLTKSWGSYCVPYIVNTYSYDGETGTDGSDGVHGVDGTSMSSSETLDKVNEVNFDDTSIGGVNQCVASDFVADTITHLSITNYSYRDTSKTNYIEVYRQGGMVTVTYNIYVLNTISKNTYVGLGTLLPVWARPPQTIYGLNMLPDDNRIRFHSSGSVQVRISTSATTDSTNIAGVISYPANDATIIEGASSLKETHLANYSGTSIPQGGKYRVKLYDANNNPLSETYVYFRINDVVYKRKTHYTGTGDEDVAVANLNINLDPAKYQITTWFDGGKYTGAGVYEGMTGDYAKCELTETITVTKSSAPTVSFGGSQTNAYAQIIATGGNPLAYHTVWVAYDGVAYQHETDSSGKVYFNLSKFDTVKVSVEVPASNRSVSVTASNTFNFQSSGTYTVKLTPNRCHNQGVSSRVTYDTSTFNIGNVKSSNDGLYVLSNRLANNATVDGLWFRYNDNGIPSNATITKIVARLGVLNLSDTGKPLSCPVTTSPLVEFREFGTSGSPFLRTASHNDNGSVTISRKDCGLVKEFTYTTSGLSYTAITGFNKDFGVLIGGRTNTGDAGYFAVDYIDVEVTYTI